MKIYHEVYIKCPSCKHMQLAKVEHTSPFYTYIHRCDCKYLIMESEWEEVDIKEVKP